MAKAETRWVCQQCNWSFARPLGRCPHCGAWDSLVETVIEPEEGGISAPRASGLRTHPEPLSAVETQDAQRIPIALGEFARVLGGGLVPGSLVLIGGEPGIGKSTLLLQVAALLGTPALPVLYISGEESPRQVKMRAERLGLPGEAIHLLPETELGAVLSEAEALLPHLRAVIVDSVQTMQAEELSSPPGSVSQVRECATRFQRWAKRTGVPVFLVGHVTKEGALAGPKVLEHIVDTVLYLEGDRFHTYRLLRSVKNRFGATSEVGVFEMRDEGLTEVPDPSEIFLAERAVNVPGSAIAVTMEGARPLLVEVQALVSQSSFGNPRRTSNGIDFNRLLLVIAVLSRRVGLRLGDQDVFANVIGGLQIEEPAADLALAAALASSVRDRPIAADLAVIGEVGLSGEVRSVGQLDARLREAAHLGFRRAIVPRPLSRQKLKLPEGIEVIPVRSVGEALEAALVRG